MGNSTVIIVLQSATLAVTLGGLGAAIYLARKARKEAKAAVAKYNKLKKATERFAQDLTDIF